MKISRIKAIIALVGIVVVALVYLVLHSILPISHSDHEDRVPRRYPSTLRINLPTTDKLTEDKTSLGREDVSDEISQPKVVGEFEKDGTEGFHSDTWVDNSQLQENQIKIELKLNTESSNMLNLNSTSQNNITKADNLLLSINTTMPFEGAKSNEEFNITTSSNSTEKIDESQRTNNYILQEPIFTFQKKTNTVKGAFNDLLMYHDPFQTEQNQRKEKYFQFGSNDNINSKILKRFHRAIRTGYLCKYEISKYFVSDTEATSKTSDYSSVIKSIVKFVKYNNPHFFIEYTTNQPFQTSISHLLSRKYHSKTSVLVMSNLMSSSQKSYEKFCNGTIAQRPNLYVVTKSMTSLNEILPKVLISSTPLSCAQILLDLSVLSDHQIPTEFEQYFGQILCQCKVSYLSKYLREGAFFSYWSSVDDLLKSVNQYTMANGFCSLTFDMTNRDHSFVHLLQYTHVVVQRNDTWKANSLPYSKDDSTDSFLNVQHLLSLSMQDQSISHLYKSLILYLLESAIHHSVSDSALPVSKILYNITSAVDLISPTNPTSITFTYGYEMYNENLRNFFAAMKVTGSLILNSTETIRYMNSFKNSKQIRFDWRNSPLKISDESSHPDAHSESNEESMSTNKNSEKSSLYSDSNEEETMSPTQHEGSNSSSTPMPSNDLLLRRRLWTYYSKRSSSYSDSSYTTSDTSENDEDVDDLSVDPDGNIDITSDPADEKNRMFAPNFQGLLNQDDLIPHDQEILNTFSVLYRKAWNNELNGNLLETTNDEVVEDESSGSNNKEDTEDTEDKDTNNEYKYKKTEDGFFLSKKSKILMKELQYEEQYNYHRWMKILKKKSITTASGGISSKVEKMLSSNLIYLFGSQVTLLSIKLSKLLSLYGVTANLKKSVPLIITITNDIHKLQNHQQLIKMMGLDNNIVANTELSIPMLSSLLGCPEKADISIVQADIMIDLLILVLRDGLLKMQSNEMNLSKSTFVDDELRDDNIVHSKTTLSVEDQNRLCQPELFEQLIATLILLSYETLLEIPSLSILRLVIQNISPSCTNYYMLRYHNHYHSFVDMIVEQFGFEAIVQVEEISSLPMHANDTGMPSMNLARSGVCIYSIRWQKLGKISDENYSVQSYQSFSNHNDSIISTIWDSVSNINSIILNRTSQFGISLYTLLHLGVVASYRQILLNLLMELPLWVLSNNSTDLNHIAGSLVAWNLFLTIKRTSSNSELELSLRNLYHDSDADEMNPLNHIKSTLRNSIFHQKDGNHQSKLSQSISQIIGIKNDRIYQQYIWQKIKLELDQHPAELASGKFSFLSHFSDYGYFPLQIGLNYPNATVISLERSELKIAHQVKMIMKLQLNNIASCSPSDSDEAVYDNLYNSPELIRFQLMNSQLMKLFKSSSSLSDWGETIGKLISCSLTTFIFSPNSVQVSWAMHVLFGEIFSNSRNIDKASNGKDDMEDISNTFSELQSDGDEMPDKIYSYYLKTGPYRLVKNNDNNILPTDFLTKAHGLNFLSSHPQLPYEEFQQTWLLSNARVGAKAKKSSSYSSYDTKKDDEPDDSFTSVLVTPLVDEKLSSNPLWTLFPMVRLDIVNMSRHVHHHYDSDKDGHTRTYTLTVSMDDTDNITATAKEVLHLTDISQASSHPQRDGILLSNELHVDGELDPTTNQEPIDQLNSRHEYHIQKFLNLLETNTTVELESPPLLDPNQLSDLEHRRRLTEESRSYLLPLGYHPNQHRIVKAHLHRDKDSFPIPYVDIYAVTLITAIRLGLESTLRNKLFKAFLFLPLYEDMAPWNIVLKGQLYLFIQSLDYIDYDTKEFTYDKDVPKTYMMMTILMNYKRTVEDFKRCGSKASTVYGLSHVSDCVGSSSRLSSEDGRPTYCPNLTLPVPCADGQCHSDFISCLRSLSLQAEDILHRTESEHHQFWQLYNNQSKAFNRDVKGKHRNVEHGLVQAMKSYVANFDKAKFSSTSLEKYFNDNS